MLKKILVLLLTFAIALLVLGESYTITFKVFNSKTYSPIKGAEIYLKDKLLGKTNENGILKYKFEVGDYDITVKAKGFKSETRTVSVILDSDEEFYLIPVKKAEKKVKLGEYKRKYAILVGVSQTADKNIPKLQFADSDVDRMKEILITYFAIPPDHIFVLKSHPNPDKGENKSTKNIFLGVLDKIIKMNLSPDDLLIIYMSTHGETIPDENGDEPDGYDEVFAMSDSKMGFTSTFLIDDELAEKLRKIHARKGLIFDACYIAGRKGMVIQTESEEQQDDLVESSDFMITSSAPGAASYESKDLGSSMFMAAFERTVEDFKDLDENSDGYVDSSEFFDGLKKNLEILSNKYLGFTQTPTLEARNVIPLMNIRTAVLDIKVSPKGATVYLDGSEAGEVKDEMMVSAKVGYHSLEITKEGYQKYERTIKVHPGMNELSVKLVKEGGWFTGKVVDSQTKQPIPGAKLIVIGSDNLIETDDSGRFEVILPKGSYSGVIIKKSGYETMKYNEPILIKGGKIFKVFELKRSLLSSEEGNGSSENSGTFLSVRSNLTGAMVFLDDRYIGKTPIEDFPVDPGNYNLKVTSSTGEIIKKQITVMSGKRNPVFIEFTKMPSLRKEPRNPEIVKTVRILINTIPSGANVTYIKDGQAHQGGVTPLALSLPEGWYSFVIEKEGYEPVKIDEDYYLAGDEVDFNINLTNIRAKKLFEEALKAYGKRKIELLEKAYSLDNYDKDIAIELIKAYMNYSTRDSKGDIVHPYFGKAMSLLEELLSTMRDDPTVHLYAGIIYFNNFDYDNARKQWKKALDLSPSLVQAYYYLYKSYKIDPFFFGKRKKELMKKYALGFVSMVKYLKLEKSYEKELNEVYRDFPDLKEWGK